MHVTCVVAFNPSGPRFNIQQCYVLPTQLYLCVLCGSEKKQQLFPYTALTDYLEDLGIDGNVTLKLILKFRMGRRVKKYISIQSSGQLL